MGYFPSNWKDYFTPTASIAREVNSKTLKTLFMIDSLMGDDLFALLTSPRHLDVPALMGRNAARLGEPAMKWQVNVMSGFCHKYFRELCRFEVRSGSDLCAARRLRREPVIPCPGCHGGGVSSRAAIDVPEGGIFDPGTTPVGSIAHSLVRTNSLMTLKIEKMRADGIFDKPLKFTEELLISAGRSILDYEIIFRARLIAVEPGRERPFAHSIMALLHVYPVLFGGMRLPFSSAWEWREHRRARGELLPKRTMTFRVPCAQCGGLGFHESNANSED